MVDSLVNSTDLRLFLPEVILLEPEDFEQARKMSNSLTAEAQWQTYLNTLALSAFEQWLSSRISDKTVYRDTNMIKVGDFKFYAIATENLLDEVVNVPQDVVQKPEFAAHFYVVLEVLEEEEQVILRGFLRYDQLFNYLNSRSRANLEVRDGCYQLPLSQFDAEPNHLLFYTCFLEAAAIPLPVAQTEGIETGTEENLSALLEGTVTKLSQWLQGAFDAGWQAIDALISPEANLALTTRNLAEGAKKGKLIDLGMQLSNQTVALLVNITEETQNKLGILIQLHPTGGERYLPPNLKLSLFSKAGKSLQEVQARSQDNYIQLKSFKAKLGTRFSIEVSLNDISVRENFEL
ncbi:MAG: DUF1822 family protein [Heteroscytonema crispum UTEX LB 1556]